MYQAVFVLGSHFVSGQAPKLTFARTGVTPFVGCCARPAPAKIISYC